MKRDASVLLVSLFNILVLLQNECVLNAQWLLSSATKARSGSCHLSSRLICLCTPGPNGHELCVGLVEDCTNPSGTLISPSPNSFGESMISFMPRIWFIDWFYVHFWYLLLADPVLEPSEIQVSKFSGGLLSWCEDRDNLGFITGSQCLGKVTRCHSLVFCTCLSVGIY